MGSDPGGRALSPWRRVGRLATIIVVGGVSVGVLGAALVPGMTRIAAGSKYSGKVAPQISALDSPTHIYDSQGREMDTLALKDRQPARLSEVPKVLIDAVISIEDHTFYTNLGIDIASMGRALISNVNSGEVGQGGSTITQQLVKNRYFKVPEKNIDRKIKEAAIAVRLTNEWSKDKILEEYLNTIYFGEGAYGVKAAAQRFFNVPLSQLNLAQAALLAGSIRDPSGNDPFSHPQLAIERRSAVLDKMAQYHYITENQKKIAELVPLPTARPAQGNLRPHDFYTEEVKNELLNDPKYGLGSDYQARVNQTYGGGLRVYTAFDPQLQVLATSSVQQILPQGIPFTAGMAVMDPNTGAVRAIVSGPGYQISQQNLYSMPTNLKTVITRNADGTKTVIPPGQQNGREPGSTFKAIDLATAIENGYSPDDQVDGTSPCYLHPPGLHPGDYKNLFTSNAEHGGGLMTLRKATQDSVNCAFFRMSYGIGGPQAGLYKVINMAYRLGWDPNRHPNWHPSDFIGSGGAQTSPLEMATIYSTFAADGVRHTPMFITKVVDAEGRVLYQANTTGARAIAPQTARTVTQMLQAVLNGTGKAARIPGRQVAGKTGTLDNETDAWFIGYTPQLTAAVWMGNPNSLQPMRDVGGVGEVFGGTYPARIWQRFMSRALANLPAVGFIPPDPSLWPSPAHVDENGRGGRVSELPPPGAVPAFPVFPQAPNSTNLSPRTSPRTSPTTSPTNTAPTTGPPVSTTRRRRGGLRSRASTTGAPTSTPSPTSGSP